MLRPDVALKISVQGIGKVLSLVTKDTIVQLRECQHSVLVRPKQVAIHPISSSAALSRLDLSTLFPFGVAWSDVSALALELGASISQVAFSSHKVILWCICCFFVFLLLRALFVSQLQDASEQAGSRCKECSDLPLTDNTCKMGPMSEIYVRRVALPGRGMKDDSSLRPGMTHTAGTPPHV